MEPSEGINESDLLCCIGFAPGKPGEVFVDISGFHDLLIANKFDAETYEFINDLIEELKRHVQKIPRVLPEIH